MKKSNDKKYEKYFMAITPQYKNYLNDIGMEGAKEGDWFVLKLDKILPLNKGKSIYYLRFEKIRKWLK